MGAGMATGGGRIVDPNLLLGGNGLVVDPAVPASPAVLAPTAGYDRQIDPADAMAPTPTGPLSRTGRIIDPDTSASPQVAAPVATGGAQPGALQLAQLHAADPAKGYGQYYGAYTNQGDLAATVWADAGQKVRLVDPHTGEVLAEGTGPEGAQQIATLANAVSKDLNKGANWDIQVEKGVGSNEFNTMQGDRTDNPHTNLLKTLVQIAAPLLGAAIPGLGPVLGAALGGFGGSLATGGNLKSALLSAVTSGLGNSLGGALSGALKGGAVSFAGTNPLGGVLSHAGSALSSALNGGASSTAAQLASQGGLSALTNGAGGALGNTVQELVVNGARGGLTGALTGALGTTAGALAPNVLSHLGQTGGASQIPGGTDGTEVAPITVTGNPGAGGFALPGVPGIGTPGSGPAIGSNATTADQPGSNGQGQDPGFFTMDNLKDILGQTIGGTGADLGVYGLAQVLGGGANKNTSTMSAPGYDGATDTGPIDGTQGNQTGTPDIYQTPPAVQMPASFGGPPARPSGGPQVGGVLGQALGLTTGGAFGGAGAPIAAAPSFNTKGSTAPDIYPWRDRRNAA